jgi:hypothetical protein
MLTSMLTGGFLGAFLGGIVGTILFGLFYGAMIVFHVLGVATPNHWIEFGSLLIVVGVVVGFGGGLPLGFGGGRGRREPKRVKTWRVISVRSVLIAGLAYGSVAGLGVLLITLLTGFGMALFNPLWAVVGIVLGLPLVLQRDPLSRLSDGRDSRQGQPVKNRSTKPMAGFVGGIMAVIPIGIAFTLQPHGAVVVEGAARLVAVGIAVVIMAWFAVWLVPQLTSGFVTELAEGNGGPQGPMESWRNDRVFGLVTGLGFGLAAGLAFGLSFWLTIGIWPVDAFAFGLVTGLTVGLTYGITSSATWSTTLAWRLQLQCSRRVPPVSLLPFLEDAHKRGVLRTVGAIHQFRHATLQDHLTNQQSTAGNTSGAIRTRRAAQQPALRL